MISVYQPRQVPNGRVYSFDAKAYERASVRRALGIGIGLSLESKAGAAPVPANYSALFPGAYQVVQTDRGLTYGSVMKAAGTAPPAVGLSGTTAVTPKPIRVATSAGTLGVATYTLSLDGGSTTAQSGTTAASVAITALPGLSVTFPVGAYSGDDVYLATCAGLADQSGNGAHYTQATAGFQPVLTVGLNGKPGLLFDGIDDRLDSALNLPTPGTTPWSHAFIFRQVVWGTGFIFSSLSAEAAGLAGLGSSPTLYMYEGGTGPVNSGAVVGTWTRGDLLWTGSTSDRSKLGSSVQTGINGGNFGLGTGRRWGGRGDGTGFFNVEMLASIYVPGTAPNNDAVFTSAAGYSGTVAT